MCLACSPRGQAGPRTVRAEPPRLGTVRAGFSSRPRVPACPRPGARTLGSSSSDSDFLLAQSPAKRHGGAGFLAAGSQSVTRLRARAP